MLSDNDLELLSAYIDGALNESDRAALEARLAADADLRREFERLRATVELINSLPTLAAPRDFTLTLRMVRRPPTLLTSAAFSALSAAAAVVLLIVGAALFTTSMRVPESNLAANQIALAPTTFAGTLQDGAQAEVSDVARESSSGAGALAISSPQPTQELPRDLLPALTDTGIVTESQFYEAPESATRAEEADDFAAADMAMNTQVDGEGTVMESAGVDQAATELRRAAPSQTPSSMAAGMAEAQLPAPGEMPMAVQPPPETAVPAVIIIPTETPTLMPSATATSTETATPTETATVVPSSTPTATPQPSVLGESGSAGVGIGLILVAFVLLLAAVVTTILRRRTL